MNENIIDLLLYLFEHYLYDNPEQAIDRTRVHNNLREAGFSSPVIDKAFDWLENLSEQYDAARLSANISQHSLRFFSESEQEKLGRQCQDFIYYLENTGILDAARREILIDSVMRLELEDISTEDLQWLALIVLFSQPGQEQAFATLESLLFDSPVNYEH